MVLAQTSVRAGASVASAPSSSSRCLGNSSAPACVAPRRAAVVLSARKPEKETEGGSIDDLNPINLGRRSRSAFDNVWQQFTRLSSPTSSFSLDGLDDFQIADNEFTTPQADFTTVLVTGATGRVGRVLVRKLLLRGYTVKALVRDAEAARAKGIPSTVELIVGDVGDYEDCLKAAEGVDKVVYAATASTDFTADVARVDLDGIGTMSRAFMDVQHRRAQKAGVSSSQSSKVTLFNFKKEEAQDCWELGVVGQPPEEEDYLGQLQSGRDYADWGFMEEEFDLVFHGSVYSRGGVAEVQAPVPTPMGDFEGLVMNCKGDGKTYTAILETADGLIYAQRFKTNTRFQTVRLPFNFFRPLIAGEPPLDPSAVSSIKLRYEQGQQSRNDVQAVDGSSNNTFSLRVCWVKAMRAAPEPAFVLVSCAGVPREGEDPEKEEIRLKFKREGEDLLKSRGVPYTVVRPGPLVEEPGGYRALVFDQGGRIKEAVGCADVADVCLRALHDNAAANKSFELAYEYTPEGGLVDYELVAHLPDKANNYLTPALSTLERNT